MNVAKIGKSTVLLGALGIVLMLGALTGVASARPHGISVGPTGKCQKHKHCGCSCHKKHHKKRHKHEKQKPQPAPQPPAAPATPAPATPQPTEQPESEPEIPYIKLQTISELEVGRERSVCAHVEAPHNDPVTVHFEAEYGEFANGGAGSAVSNGNSCALYTAPTSVPQSYFSGGYFDFIEAIAWDTVTGKSAWSFEVVELVSQTNF